MKKLLYIIAFITWTISSFGQLCSPDSLRCSPNPFSDNPTLTYYVATKDTLSITIYNTFGQIMGQVFVDSIINIGSYSCTLMAGTYPAGIYHVTLQNKSGNLCPRKIIKLSDAGITQFKNPTDLKICPNPTTEIIKIETTQPFDLLKIYSIDNKLVKEIINPPKNISVADLPAGVYLLTGFNKDKLIFNYKIIRL